MAAKTLCSVADCDKTGKMRRGMCAVHYGRWSRHGDPLAGRDYPVRGEPRAYLEAHMWDDCPKWPYARGKRGYGHIQHEGVVKDVHRLVCEIVNGPPPSPDHEAAHNCGLGHEGCFGARCLRWALKSENQADRISHGTHDRGERQVNSKLTADQVRLIRADPRMHREIADEFGLSRPTVTDIKNRRRWAWLT